MLGLPHLSGPAGCHVAPPDTGLFNSACWEQHAVIKKSSEQITKQSKSPLHQAIHIFVTTWALFLLCLLLPLPMGIPAYLGLDAAWICFLNSLLIAVVLCVVCPAMQLAQGLAAVLPDNFCEWRFNFSLAAEDRTRLNRLQLRTGLMLDDVEIAAETEMSHREKLICISTNVYAGFSPGQTIIMIHCSDLHVRLCDPD